jgi:hypothetical protein
MDSDAVTSTRLVGVKTQQGAPGSRLVAAATDQTQPRRGNREGDAIHGSTDPTWRSMMKAEWEMFL